jgi:hypothetical protein
MLSQEQLSRKIAMEVQRATGKGLNAARIFLSSRVKETLSVPAPRRRVKSLSGEISYVATTPAQIGAPPRKLSGRLRSSVNSAMISDRLAYVGVSARSVKGFNYPRYHEESGKHPFLLVTVLRYRREIETIFGKSLRIG